MGRSPYAIAVIVVLLLGVTVFSLFHCHVQLADQGCQLCHVPHFHVFQAAIDLAYIIPPISEQDWSSDGSNPKLETSIWRASGRSPPGLISFSI